MQSALAALFLLAATSPEAPGDQAPPRVLKDAVVVSTAEAEADSGYVAFWNRIDVRTAGGEPMTLFQIHMQKGNPTLPPVGATCDFTYRVGQLGGSAGPGLDTSHDWPMVDSVSCRPA